MTIIPEVLWMVNDLLSSLASHGRQHRLWPTFFVFGDRQQITDLLVESYTKLAIAVGISTKDAVSCKTMGKTDAVITVAATRNLNIEKSVANALGSGFIPYHLLCKS